MNKYALIDSIKKYLINFSEIEFAYLYGSMAIGKEIPGSDVDIAIYQKMQVSSYDLRMTEFKIEDDLIKNLHPGKFDVRSLNDAPVIVIGKILNEGSLLFYKNENFYYDYLVNMRLQYMDYLMTYNPIFKKRYESLLNDR